MKRFLPNSLFGRLVLIFAAGLTLVLGGAALINLHERSNLIEHAGGERTAQRVATTARLVDHLAPPDRRELLRAMSGMHWHMRLSPEAPSIPAARGGSGHHAAHLAAILAHELGPGYPLHVAEVPAPGDAHAPGGYLIAVRLHDGGWLTISDRRPPPPDDRPVGLLVELGALLAVALVLSLYAVTRVTRPLAMLAAAADALGRDIRRPPLPETGPAEVSRAAAAFNRMQQRLAGFLDARLRMLTAISHDLKTPVTRLRLRAEMLDDEAQREGINRDLDDMDGMLSAALDYLRGELEVEPLQQIDVDALVTSLASDAQDLGQPVTVEGGAAAPYRGRALALRRCLGNLVQNALRYGGEAAIRIEDGPDSLVIRVADRGPGLPAHELERVFEPFYRAESSRNRATGGTGLGLAIARGVAEAHGGSLRLANRSGGGLEATLALPR